MSKKPAEPRVVFTVKVYARPAMSRAVETSLIRWALDQASREFGGGFGGKLKGQIFGEYDLNEEARPFCASFLYEPSAPA